MTMPKTNSPYLTTAEVAEYLRTSKQRVLNLVHLGKLPVHKLGSANRYLKTDVESLVRSPGSD